MKIRKIMAILLSVILVCGVLPVSASSAAVVDNYYNVNFNDGTFNNSASTLAFGRVAGSATVDYPQDEAKGNGAVRYTLADTGAYVLRDNGFKPAALNTDKKTIWYEMSIKFEGHVCDVDLRATAAIFDINKDGSLYFTSLADSQGSYGPAKIAPVTIEANTWYHIKAAVDFADTVNIGGTDHPKFYAWVNGEFMKLDSSEDCSLVWSSTINVKKYEASRLDFYIGAKEAGDAVLFDDVKIYTTSMPVRNTEGALDFDPMAIYEGAHITSDKLLVDEEKSTIYAPADDTLGDIYAMLSSATGITYYKDGIAKNADLVMKDAVGGKVFARSSGGVGVKSYAISEGMRLFDVDKSTAKWEKTADGIAFSAVTAASGITKGDKIKLSLDAQNKTANEQTGSLVLAVYNNDMLVNCTVTDFAVPVGGAKIESALTDVIYNAEYFETEKFLVKAFFWNSKTDKTSVFKSIALK